METFTRGAAGAKGEALLRLAREMDKEADAGDRDVGLGRLFGRMASDPELLMFAAEHDELLAISTSNGWSAAHIVAYSSKEAGSRILERAGESGDERILRLEDDAKWTVAHALACCSRAAAVELKDYPGISDLEDRRGLTVRFFAEKSIGCACGQEPDLSDAKSARRGSCPSSNRA